MKMKEIRLKNYSVFPDCESEFHRTGLIQAITYVDQIAGTVGVDISEWDVLDIFRNPNSDKGFIHTDKAKINKIFFEELERVKSLPPPPSHLNQEVIERLKALFSQLAHTKRKRLLENKSAMQSSANSHYQNYTNYMVELARANEQLMAPPESGEKYIQQINEATVDGFFEVNPNYISEIIQFFTKPVVLTYKNTAQAADITVPMGRFLLSIDMKSMSVRCAPLNDLEHPNVKLNSQYHPHIDGDYRFCFGNMLTDFNKAVGECDYKKTLSICRAVLTTYCNDNPFQYLYRYQEVYNERIRYEQRKQAAQKQSPPPRPTTVIVDEQEPQSIPF